MLVALLKYIALDSSRRAILNRACFQLANMRFALELCSFKKLVFDLQFLSTEWNHVTIDADELNNARLISWAISVAAVRLPWKSSCLVQALAAQRMLKSMNIPGVLYLGARFDSAEATKVQLAAHAWVKSGGEFITGDRGLMPYKSMAAYAWA